MWEHPNGQLLLEHIQFQLSLPSPDPQKITTTLFPECLADVLGESAAQKVLRGVGSYTFF